MGQKYEAEFKRQVVRQHTELKRPVSELSAELGISSNVVYRWVKESRENPAQAFSGSGHLRPDDDELRRLRQQVMDLQEENDILKKAAAYFAKLHR